jgi:hypothetical protein
MIAEIACTHALHILSATAWPTRARADDQLAMSGAESMQDTVAERQQHQDPGGLHVRAVALLRELVLKLGIQAGLQGNACRDRAPDRLQGGETIFWGRPGRWRLNVGGARRPCRCPAKHIDRLGADAARGDDDGEHHHDPCTVADPATQRNIQHASFTESG